MFIFGIFLNIFLHSQDLKKEFNEEKSRLVKERDGLKKDLSKATEEFGQKRENSEREIDALKQKLARNNDGIESANADIRSLNAAKEKLEDDYHSMKLKCEEKEDRLTKMSDELEKLKLVHSASIKDSQIDTKVRIERVTKELNDKWAAILK